MNRFNDEARPVPDGPIALLEVESFDIEARDVDGQRRYMITFSDPERGYVDVMLGSAGTAQLCVLLAKAAISGCDQDWLTMLMVLLTESRQESIDILFESGHAKDSLDN